MKKTWADFQFCMSVPLTCAEFGAHKLFFVSSLHFLITWGRKILEKVFEKWDFLRTLTIVKSVLSKG